MGKYIPESVLENRSELGRTLLSDRYYLIHRKKLLTAVVFFLLLGGLGVHRFYFEQWVWGIIVIIFSLAFAIFPLVIFLDHASTAASIFIVGILTFFTFEFIMIFFNTKTYNSKLADEIKSEAGVL